MRYLCSLIFITFTPYSFGQTQSFKESGDNLDLKFSLILTTYNHAERIYDGTTTYLLTDTSIQVKKFFFGEKEGNVLFSKVFPTSQKTLLTIKNIGLDSLNDYYSNYCVMITSGNEYFLSFKSSSSVKEIRLHHYYLKQLDDLVNLINSFIPKEYQLRYLTKETEQGCKLR